MLFIDPAKSCNADRCGIAIMYRKRCASVVTRRRRKRIW
jgi:hypothetical protein